MTVSARNSHFLQRALGLLLGNPAVASAVGCLVILAVGETISRGFAAPGQIIAQLTVAAILAVVAAGQGFAVLAGREGIDLSIGSTMSLAALVAGNVMGGQDIAVLPALLAAIGAGMLVGWFNGLGITLLRIPPLVMTLGTAGVITGLLVVLTQGQTSGSAAPSLGAFIVKPLLLGLPGILFVWAALLVLIHLVLRSTRFGVNLYAIGSNDVAAALSGVRVTRTRLIAYMLSGVFAGFGGFLLLGYTGSVFVGAGEQYVLPSVIAVVIGGTALTGGRGSYTGTAAGAVFLTLLTAFLTTLQVEPASRQMLFGMTLLGFMIVYGREEAPR